MNFLIAGLGNIGAEYVETRHNIGFKIIDFLAESQQIDLDISRHAFYGNYKLKGKNIHLIKPTTFMNLSGKAVKYWLNELKVPQENMLVVLDDLAIPFGSLRIRSKGSDGGHNGLKDINTQLGNQDYARLRFGIGSEFTKGRQVDYVLGEWSKEEKPFLAEKIKRASEAVHSFVLEGLPNAMTKFNRD